MSLKPAVKEVERVCISTPIPLPASALYLKPDQVNLNYQKLDGGENYPVVRQKPAWLISSSAHTRTQTPDLQLPSSDPLHLKEREHPNLGFPQMADNRQMCRRLRRLSLLFWPFFLFFSGLCWCGAISPSSFFSVSKKHELALG